MRHRVPAKDSSSTFPHPVEAANTLFLLNCAKRVGGLARQEVNAPHMSHSKAKSTKIKDLNLPLPHLVDVKRFLGVPE